MSSEFLCDYCSVSPRHPCYSREEASQCPNASDRGSLLDFKYRDVTAWLRDRCFGISDADKAVIEAACEVIEREEFY